MARNILNLFAGRMLHSIAEVGPKPFYVDSIEKFDALMEKLNACSEFALDSETKNLSNHFNAIYFLQFAFSKKRGYVLPLDHPRSPFNEKERKYIKKRLRKFFGDRNNRGKIMIPFNGTFDLRILRTQLKIPFITLTVHEITAGEQLLDENLGIFTRGFKTNLNGSYIKTPYGNLRSLCMYYGNDWYWKAEFSKEERSTAGNFAPDDPKVLNYCLPAGQVVITPEGRKDIQDVVPGDLVLSMNKHRQAEFKPVHAVAKHERKGTRRLLRIKYGAGSMVVTDDHPVWSEERGEYVEAGLLRKGESIRVEPDGFVSGNTVRIPNA